MESAVPDQQGRISLESFQRSIHRQHFPYEDPSYLPSSPPPRPGSGSRVQRQSTHPSPSSHPPSSHPPSSGHHHPRNPVKHIGSPQGHGGYDRDGYRDGYPQVLEDHKRSSYRQEQSHTPEVRGTEICVCTQDSLFAIL